MNIKVILEHPLGHGHYAFVGIEINLSQLFMSNHSKNLYSADYVSNYITQTIYLFVSISHSCKCTCLHHCMFELRKDKMIS